MLNQSQLCAAGIALLLAAALGAWFVVAWRRTHYSFMQFVFYLINCVLVRALWRVRVSGPLPIPPGQGAIVVCNHRSSIDPLVVQYATMRAIRWMVAKEFVYHPASAWIFHVTPHIPVSRAGIDTAATKLAIRMAEQGEVLGLFPEGRINETDRFLCPGRLGAALIALKARVPVIPCYIDGSPYDGTAFGPLLMPAKVRLTVGDPIDISEYYDREGDRDVLILLTRRFLKEIARLGGRPDYEPEIAATRGNGAERMQNDKCEMINDK